MPAQNINGVPPWISGPKPGKPIPEWAGFVAHVLRGTHGQLDSSDKTSETEAGLGIKKASRYWYICRADSSRGQFLFCWRARVEDWPEGELGVVPFDSGGLFHGWIKTTSDLTTADRVALFARYDRPLREWLAHFAAYLGQHYDSLSDYILAAPPKPGIPEIICSGGVNAALAWTWEARAGCDIFGPHMQLEAAYFTDEDADDFLKWLQEPGNPYELSERLEVQTLFLKTVRRRQISPSLATILNSELIQQAQEGFSA